MLLLTRATFAQALQQLNYQAIVQNTAGNALPANTQVGLRFQIHQGTANGLIVYSETASAITNFIVMGKRMDAGTTVMPAYFANKDFDKNLKGVMFNEADNEHNAIPILWDGTGVRL